jgi:hypothetical protein
MGTPSPYSPAGPLRFATWCALGPALLGCGSFTVWLLRGARTGDLETFVWIGCACLYLGGFALLSGLFALLVASARGATGFQVLRIAILLLGNLLLAFLCIAGVVLLT